MGFNKKGLNKPLRAEGKDYSNVIAYTVVEGIGFEDAEDGKALLHILLSLFNCGMRRIIKPGKGNILLGNRK